MSLLLAGFCYQSELEGRVGDQNETYPRFNDECLGPHQAAIIRGASSPEGCAGPPIFSRQYIVLAVLSQGFATSGSRVSDAPKVSGATTWPYCTGGVKRGACVTRELAQPSRCHRCVIVDAAQNLPPLHVKAPVRVVGARIGEREPLPDRRCGGQLGLELELELGWMWLGACRRVA